MKQWDQTPQRPPKTRSKSALEPMMEGRFVGENRLLIFSPTRAENILVALCLILGPLQFLAATFGFTLGDGILAAILSQSWLGLAVLAAGLYAVLSAERLICLLREGTYIRKEARGLRITRGRLSELDALSVVSSQDALGVPVAGGMVAVVRLVLYWKGSAHPPLILAREVHRVSSPAELPGRSQALVAKASIYGKALGIPVYNGSGVISPAPLPFV